MEWGPFLLSLQLAVATTTILIPLAVLAARPLARWRGPSKPVVEAALTLPLVLPPTVLGYYLLVGFGRGSSLGGGFEEVFGAPLAFSFEGLVAATSHMEDRRIPELFCGFRRRTGRAPTLYPAACSPQAWAAGAPFLLLQGMLGVTFDPDARRIRLVRPRLPALVGDVTVRNLALAGKKIRCPGCGSPCRIPAADRPETPGEAPEPARTAPLAKPTAPARKPAEKAPDTSP